MENQNATIQQLKDLLPEESTFIEQDDNPDFENLEIEMSKSVEEEEFNLRDQENYFDDQAFDQIYCLILFSFLILLEKQRESQELKQSQIKQKEKKKQK